MLARLASVRHHWVAQRPTLYPSLQHPAVLTASPGRNSGTVTQVEEGTQGPGNPGAAQRSAWTCPSMPDAHALVAGQVQGPNFIHWASSPNMLSVQPFDH